MSAYCLGRLLFLQNSLKVMSSCNSLRIMDSCVHTEGVTCLCTYEEGCICTKAEQQHHSHTTYTIQIIIVYRYQRRYSRQLRLVLHCVPRIYHGFTDTYITSISLFQFFFLRFAHNDRSIINKYPSLFINYVILRIIINKLYQETPMRTRVYTLHSLVY